MSILKSSTPEIQEELHKRLQQYNAEYMSDSKDYSFHIEENGVAVAGIIAESTGDTLEVEFLYVDEAVRGQKLGEKLLAKAEECAKRDGLKRVLLNTYSFQAPGFYKKEGYTQLFEIKNCFDSHSQYFFRKEL